MELERTKFRDLLKRVMPCLGNNSDLLPDISNIAFYDNTIGTCNGFAALMVAFPALDFECCVDGKSLWKLINNSKAPKINLLLTDGGLSIKLGRSKALLPLQQDTLIRRLKARTPTTEYTDQREAFIDAIKIALIKGNKQEMGGVFVHKDLVLSTNRSGVSNQYVLPFEFENDMWIAQSEAEKLIRNYDFTESAYQVNNDNMISGLHFKGSDIAMNISLQNPQTWVNRNMLKILTEHFFSKVDNPDKVFTITEEFIQGLKEGIVTASTDSAKNIKINLTFVDNSVILNTQSTSGVFNSNIELDCDFGENPIKETYALNSIIDVLQIGYKASVIPVVHNSADAPRYLLAVYNGSFTSVLLPIGG